MQKIQLILFLSAFLFSTGLYIIFTRRNAIMVLLGIELLFNSANLNLVAFNQLRPGQYQGQMFALFIIIVAVCEAAVGVAIILKTYHYYHSSVPDQISEIKEAN